MNNAIFRLGSESGWCTTTHLIDWRMPCHVDFVNYDDTHAARLDLIDVLASAPHAVHTLLWVMSMFKRRERPVSPLFDPGLVTRVKTKDKDRVEVFFKKNHGMELRLKVKEVEKGRQLDLISEKVW